MEYVIKEDDNMFRNWVIGNFPFLENDFDALTDYELFCKMLEYVKEFAKDNDKLLDLFAGSGAIVIAAEQTNTVAYAMEYEPFYCDIIISRWEQFTNKQAIKIN